MKKMLNWMQNTKNTKVEVVLRGDIVKDDSGSYAVFTETRIISISSDSRQNIMDIISQNCQVGDGQAADAVSAYTQMKMEDAHKLFKNIPNRKCPDIWIRLPRHTWPKSLSSMEDPVVPLERNLSWSSFGRTIMGKAI